MTTTNATTSSGPNPAKKPRRWRRRALLFAGCLAAYPAFVVVTVYSITLSSGLPGGRHGPRDAYRHCLASAVVSYTTSPRLVEFVTQVMEGDGAGASHAMDAHNNRIGAAIGTDAPSWAEMLLSVRSAIDNGREELDPARLDADATRVVWLPRDRWRDGWL